MFGSYARFALKIWLGFVAAAFLLLCLLALLFFVFGDDPKTWHGIQKYWTEILVFGGYALAICMTLSLPSVLIIGVGIGLLPLHILENKKERLLAFLGVSAVNNVLYFALTTGLQCLLNHYFTATLCVYTLSFYAIMFILGCLPIAWLNERTAEDYFAD